LISIIVCSISAKLIEQLSNNIKETIGVPHELIAIDNTIKKRSKGCFFYAKNTT
jgi:hypothetical protein